MAQNQSMALAASQALLHCVGKGVLYDIDMTLGKRIKAARANRGILQRTIAEEFGVTEQAVSQWERDADVPGLARIVPLARILKVPVIWLLDGAGTPPLPEGSETRFETLAPGDRAIVDGLIDTLRKQRGEVA